MTTEVDYGINVTNGKCHPYNPLDENLGTEEEARQAAYEWLRDNPEDTEVIVFRMEFRNNTCVRDETLDTITREDYEKERKAGRIH